MTVTAFQQANQLLREGKLEEAVVAYRRAIAQNPNFYLSHHNLGEVLWKLGRLDEAEQAFRQAIRLKPSATFSSSSLAQLLKQSEKQEEAKKNDPDITENEPRLAEINNKSAKGENEEQLPTVQEIVKTQTEDWDSINPPHQIQTYKISIKTSVPNLSQSHVWGDFHFAHALKRAFERQGHYAHVDCQDTWATHLSDDDDIVIVLRGRHGYQPKKHQINLLWIISHPDRIPLEELALFDHIFVASKHYAEKLSQQVIVPVSCMYQCTDIDLFYPAYPTNIANSEILFVGNSRNVFRPIVRDVIGFDIEVAVYGTFWEKFIDSKYIKGTHIPNEQLHKYYSKCQILLNDHWDTMRQEGFLSNRLFDASACGTFIISDPVRGLEEVLGDCIEIYQSPQELVTKILYYKNNPDERHRKAKTAQDSVIKNHTFDHRAKQFIESVLKIQKIQQKNQNLRSLLNATETINIYNNPSKKADVIQQQYFDSNVDGLANGLRTTHSPNQSLFYESVWQLSRQTPNYQDLISEFINSESKLIDLLSIYNFYDQEIPVVSIIMPTYNRSYIIAEGIQSIIEQTYENWELFVCDDGSTDNTRAIVEQFQDPRIHYLQLKKANGSVARNVGVRFSQGKYISYLDSDNLWHPQYLWICIQTLEKQPHSMCCYTGYLDTEFNLARLELKKLCYKPFDYYQLLDRNFIDLNSFVHRRSLYEWIGGFDESLVRLQDWDLILRYTLLFPPLMIKNYLVFYRRSTAWNQVTKLFFHLDVRSFVQNKILSSVEKGQLSLKILMSCKPTISILTSNQTSEIWLKSLAVAKILSEDFEVQLLVLLHNSNTTKLLKPDGLNCNIEWLSLTSFKEYTSIEELMQNSVGFNLLSQMSKKITGDILLTTDSSLVSIAITTAVKILYNKNKHLIMYDNFYHQLLKYLRLAEGNRIKDGLLPTNLERSFQRSQLFPPFSFREISIKFEENIPILLSEMIDLKKGYLQAIPIGPTILDTTAKPLSTNNKKYKNQLGFKDGEITIGFLLKADIGLIKNQILDFYKKVQNPAVKILLLQDISMVNVSESNQQNIDLASENIKVMKPTNQNQMIETMKGTDLCVLWQEDGFVGVNSQIPLSFVYALVAGSIPVCEPRGEFIDWAECKYCLTIEVGNWDGLAELCIELRHYSKRITEMKANGRKLYNMRFSPVVTREKLKYVVHETCSHNLTSGQK
ncbi:glycosyltransferase [Microcoleus sp. LEGE 07076]|uniref:glycosyltransferase n=1 Tax=Microcoleus sp. LEGE 07076 TaxID=915322 RepID=UPI0018801211|nr:glycosyltransferase [Microcoleus sp. LEGE 07076]MBE9187208.1 glycosyltransferase [Microcoleus sp. LEGE 07076]